MNTLHKRQLHYHPQVARWITMDVGLRSIVNQGERHSRGSSADHLVSQVKNKIPTETRIAMVKILLSLRDTEP